MAVSKSAEAKARAAAVRRARAALERLVPDELEREAYAEAVDRYADAVALAAKLREEWDGMGRPSLAEGSMRQPIPHPLVKMIADADAAAAKYAAAVGLDVSARTKRAPGRPVASVSAPDRAASPPRMRRVK
jgi:hypothetical protein